MRRRLGSFALLLVITVSACGGATTSDEKVPPAILESVEGSDVGRVTLTQEAARRIGISTETVAIGESPRSPTDQLMVPYGAVVYDAEGNTWAYVNSRALEFERHPITVDFVEGDTAFLLAGPTVGTPIVVMGTAELSGFENGVGG